MDPDPCIDGNQVDPDLFFLFHLTRIISEKVFGGVHGDQGNLVAIFHQSADHAQRGQGSSVVRWIREFITDYQYLHL